MGVMLTLTVMLTLCPEVNTSDQSAILSLSLDAISYACLMSVSGSGTQNSSPPKRAR